MDESRDLIRNVYEDLYDAIYTEMCIVKDKNGYIVIHDHDTYEYSLKTDVVEFINNEMEDDYADEFMLEEEQYKAMYRYILLRIARDTCDPFKWDSYRDVSWYFRKKLENNKEDK